MNPKQAVLAQYLEVEADTLDTSKGDNSCICGSPSCRKWIVREEDLPLDQLLRLQEVLTWQVS
jgi:hypothetical protein